MTSDVDLIYARPTWIWKASRQISYCDSLLGWVTKSKLLVLVAGLLTAWNTFLSPSQHCQSTKSNNSNIYTLVFYWFFLLSLQKNMMWHSAKMYRLLTERHVAGHWHVSIRTTCSTSTSWRMQCLQLINFITCRHISTKRSSTSLVIMCHNCSHGQ